MYKYEDYEKSAEFIKNLFSSGFNPETAVVLGSGLGVFAEDITIFSATDYAKIPNFPVSTVESHKGELVLGNINGKDIIVLNGRFHAYEGYSMAEAAYYVRVLKLLGIKNLILTNASGAINKSFVPGDIVLITDHIKLVFDNPLTGLNIDSFGPRFNDMTHAYCPRLQKAAVRSAEKTGLDLKKGVYSYMSGPCFETPAEIKALAVLGADLVGMSTVPEVIVASHCKMNVLGISVVTNMAAGILDTPIDHDEISQISVRTKPVLTKFLKTVINDIQKG